MEIRKLFEKKIVPGKPEPVDDTTFTAQVLESQKPVLIDFWAPWCAPCRLVGGLLAEIGPEYADRMRILKLNVDENPQTAGRFGITSIPTMILFKGGRPVDQIVGAMPLNPLRQWIEKHVGTSNTASSPAAQAQS